MADDISIDESFDDFPRIEEAFQRRLDESLDPRGPGSLFDLIGSLGVEPGSLAVDVGCGDGRAAVELATRFGLRVHGVDPVAAQVEEARAAAAAAGVVEATRFEVGTAERLPVDAGAADLVLCKEVLMFADLAEAMRELGRVLAPGGVGVVVQVLTGPRMSDDEGRQFWERDLAYGAARSMRAADIEAAIAGAGLELRQRVDYGGEWGEYAQEQLGAGGRRLLHAARLLRDPDRYIAEFGDASYRIMLGDCLWHVYRMIGKLEAVAFVFGRAGASDSAA